MSPNLPAGDGGQPEIIVLGTHFDLPDSLRHRVYDQASRLLRENPRILRLRFDLEHDTHRSHGGEYIARGHIEVGGPDILASVASEDASKSIDTLMDRLDASLRRRQGEHRHQDSMAGRSIIPFSLPHPN